VPGGNELVLVDSTGTQPLVPSAPGIEWAQPRFAPDGVTIAAVRVHGGWHDIVLLNREGALLREVTDDPAIDVMPAFSPDGRLLVWSREVDGTPQIAGLALGEDGTTVRTGGFVQPLRRVDPDGAATYDRRTADFRRRVLEAMTAGGAAVEEQAA